ncbi:MAG: hypothetical protein JW751_06250 [Polyangiaceae bacterium]|nr:hypothetical protein [Polyangiaceae bacterium]
MDAADDLDTREVDAPYDAGTTGDCCDPSDPCDRANDGHRDRDGTQTWDAAAAPALDRRAGSSKAADRTPRAGRRLHR